MAAHAHEPTFRPPKNRMSLKSLDRLLSSGPSAVNFRELGIDFVYFFLYRPNNIKGGND